MDESQFPVNWLVKPLLVEGEPGAIGGPQKSLKTSVGIELLASLATGTKFLGLFETGRPRKVLIISGESGPGTLQETARRICKAKGFDLKDCDNLIWNFRLPRLSVEEDLLDLGRFLRQNRIKVVIIDPLYLSLLYGAQGKSATSLYDIGPLLKMASDSCLEAGATPIFIHHTTKTSEKQGKRWRPLGLEALAFAGIAEFVRQWFIISRRGPYIAGSGTHKLYLNYGGSAGQNGLLSIDVREGVRKEIASKRIWELTVKEAEDPNAIESEGEVDGQPPFTEDDLKAFVASIEHVREGASKTAILKKCGLARAKAEMIFQYFRKVDRIVPATIAQLRGGSLGKGKGFKLNPLVSNAGTRIQPSADASTTRDSIQTPLAGSGGNTASAPPARELTQGQPDCAEPEKLDLAISGAEVNGAPVSPATDNPQVQVGIQAAATIDSATPPVGGPIDASGISAALLEHEPQMPVPQVLDPAVNLVEGLAVPLNDSIGQSPESQSNGSGSEAADSAASAPEASVAPLSGSTSLPTA